MSAHPAEGITRAGETSAAALLPSTPGTQHVALQEGQGWLWKRKEDELQGHVCVTSRAGQSQQGGLWKQPGRCRRHGEGGGARHEGLARVTKQGPQEPLLLS